MSNDGFTKKFGIDNLIRNVTFADAICFLIENSIDAAEKASELNPSKEYHIDLQLYDDRIFIEDDCVGMCLADAEEFLLKIQKKHKFDDKCGEGLKKAIFVLGNEIEIKSFNEDSFTLNLKILKDNDEKLWDSTKYNQYVYNNNVRGFSVEIKDFNKDFKNYLLKKKYDEIITRIKVKYRYIIHYSNIKISINGYILEPKFINADKIYEEKTVINDEEVKVILYNNIKDKDDNGIDFIVNNRVIVEKEKSNKIGWNKRIIAKRHSYTKFFGEVIIDSANVEKLGVDPSHKSINFSKRFCHILDFMNSIIENNRKYYKKNSIIVQLEIDENDLNEWKSKLEKQEGTIKYAKDVIEKLYKIGANNI